MEKVTLDLLRERVALARKEAGLSQDDLGAAIGVDGSAISKIENGTRNLSSVELAKLARVCGKPLDWFFSREESPFLLLRGVATSSEARHDAAWLVEFSGSFAFLSSQLLARR